ncbi:hypothetical protein [Streptomyces sp. NPDC020298]|uniref:hypothetical protein n=1 Tax=unclassified Streptomyces TaxID=2593676 RepID=UPI0033E79768
MDRRGPRRGRPDSGSAYGGPLASGQLEARLAKALRAAATTEHAADEQTCHARELAAAAAEQPSAGQRTAQAAAAVLAAADQLAAQAKVIKERIEAAAGRSRFAMPPAGTSRAEQRALLAQYTRQMADAHDEQQRAERTAATARQQAWQTLRTSPYAEAFRARGALGEAPADPTALRQQLAAMHAHLPTLATRIDTAHAEEAQQARHEAVELSAKDRDLRTTAEQLQAEQRLRRQISAQAPSRQTAGRQPVGWPECASSVWRGRCPSLPSSLRALMYSPRAAWWRWACASASGTRSRR